MPASRLISTVVGVVCVGGLAAGVYATKARWSPHVFPDQAAAKSEAAKAEDPHAGHDHGAAVDRVKLSPQAQANLKLDVDALVPEEYWRKVQIPGMVVDRPGETDRGVAARAAGLIMEVKAHPGDTVKSGDVLFRIQLVSEFVQSTQTELAKAARELEFATTKRTRTAEFVRLGTKSSADLVEDDNQVRRFTTQVEAYRRQLTTFGLTPSQVKQAEKGEVVTEIEITAPIRATPLKSTDSTSKPDDPLIRGMHRNFRWRRKVFRLALPIGFQYIELKGQSLRGSN